jgi:DNA-directed RNA polymerase subunit RPC12/RpoP
LADSASPQRAYRAACPGCGAPVLFRSAQSSYAVCDYCRSTVVRDGEVLKRLGKMGELFDDHSLLQIGAGGKQDKRPFTVVGRLQYQYPEGRWTEWQLMFDDGGAGTLSEDNGAYVLSEGLSLSREVPAAGAFRVGMNTALNGKPFSVASIQEVHLVSAQGELPKLPPLNHPFQVAELRSPQGEVVSIDYGTSPPQLSLGREVSIEGLAMTGLKDESAKEEKGRAFDCPNCGASVEPKLDGSKSITCDQCGSIIDLSRGVGAELSHVEQTESFSPDIALGKVGQLQGAHWQVVGFQHRVGHEPDDPDEQFGWNEYLLYNAKKGFCFLVDSTEGWSLVRPVTGAPEYKGGNSARYQGRQYSLKYSYEAETTYVQGEFYWQVQRGQKTSNRDFASGKEQLAREESSREVTWSAGSSIPAASVAKAFGVDDPSKLDAAPLAGKKGVGCGTLIVVAIIVIILLIILAQCANDNSGSGSSYRSSGSSYGGSSSSSGGHK